MVATPSKEETLEILNIPIDEIKVGKRLRTPEPEKIEELAFSIQDCGLLHPVTVSKTDVGFQLLSGNTRLHAFKLLNRKTIPATINGGNKLLDLLIEIEENICDTSLTFINQAIHLKKREEVLTQLGRRAKSGDNRFNRHGLSNSDLAKGLGMSKRSYMYLRSVANMNPKVLAMIDKTEFANNKTDIISLTRESEEVQLETAKMLSSGATSTFKRALTLARCKVMTFDWNEEQLRIKELIGHPKSVMKFQGDSSPLASLCKLVKEDENRRIKKHMWGTNTAPNYATHPDHAAYFINFYSKEGDLVLDCFAGSGINVVVGAALRRKIVAYDLSPQNLDCMRKVCLEHTPISPNDLTLHHSCGVELKEYENKSEMFDLISFDPPYGFHQEIYSDDERDLSNIKSKEEFYKKIELNLINCKRLIKKSDFSKKEIHPIVIKCGSHRNTTQGLHDMATEIEIIAKRLNLVLHDKVINVLDSMWGMFNMSRVIDNHYSLKIHETSLIFVKYEN